MELIDKGFTQKIADKYTNLKLFSINFAPIISTKRIIPRMRWLELVYALPYLVLRREIFNPFKKTKNVLTSPIKQIWNVFVHLDFPLGRYKYITTREIVKIQDAGCKSNLYPVSWYPISFPSVNLVKSRGFYFKSSLMELAQPASRENTRMETGKESAFANYQVPVVTTQPPVVSHKPSAVRYEDQATYVPTSTSDFTIPLFSYYSFKPAFFLNQRTVPVKQQGVSLNLQKSDTALRHYGQLERETLQNGQKIISYFNFKTSSMELAQPVSYETSTTTRIETEKEWAFTNYQLPVVTPQPIVVSHKPSAVRYEDLATYILTSASDFIAPLFSYYPFKPTFFLSQKTVPIMQREVSLIAQKSDTALPPYGHLERGTLLNGQRIISYFNFKSSSMELAQPVSYETSTTTRIETEKEWAFTNYQLPVVTPQPIVVSHKPSAVRYEDLATYILTSASDFIAPLFSYYPFKPTFFLSQKTVPIMQREVSLIAQKSDTALPPYGHLERGTLLNGQRIISYFNFKSSSMELAQPVSYETSTTTRIETEKEWAFTNYQLPVVTPQPIVVSHKPSAVRYEDLATYILTSASDFIAPLFSYYPFKPTFFLSQKTVPIMQREVSLIAQKSDAIYRPYGHLERETLESGQKIISYLKSSSMELAQPVSRETTRIEREKESAVANYQLPVVTPFLSTLSHKPASVSNKSMKKTSFLSSAKDFMNNKQTRLNASEVEKAPIYHSYPEIEHVTSTHTEIIKERVIEKEDKPAQVTPQLPSIDVNRLAGQIYQLIERRVRIEKERRGL